MSDEINPLIVARKGEEILAKMDEGTTLPVKVRIMPLRVVHKTASLIEGIDECDLLEFVCAPVDEAQPLPAGWVDSLDEDSHDLLVRKARSLNFPRVAAWVKRQVDLMGDVAPLRRLTPTSVTSSPTA